jgi:hypothetical protein
LLLSKYATHREVVSAENEPPTPCDFLAKSPPSKHPTKNRTAIGKSTAGNLFIQHVTFTYLPGENFEFRFLDRHAVYEDILRTVNIATNMVNGTGKLLSYTRKVQPSKASLWGLRFIYENKICKNSFLAS